MPNIKDYIAFYKVGVLERSTDLIKIVPAHHVDSGGPVFDFVRGIWVGFYPLPHVLTRKEAFASAVTATSSISIGRSGRIQPSRDNSGSTVLLLVSGECLKIAGSFSFQVMPDLYGSRVFPESFPTGFLGATCSSQVVEFPNRLGPIRTSANQTGKSVLPARSRVLHSYADWVVNEGASTLAMTEES